MAPTLFGGAMNRGLRSMWLAQELGMELDLVDVPLGMSGMYGQEGKGVYPQGTDAERAEFARINPNMKLPALKMESGTGLFESMAINHYLARRAGGPVAPGNPEEDALCLQWSFWTVAELEPHAVVILFSVGGTPTDPNVARWLNVRREDAEEGMKKALNILETSLEGRSYLVGERFTIADLNVASVLMWALTDAKNPFGRFEKLPRTRKWLKACITRPGLAKARGMGSKKSASRL